MFTMEKGAELTPQILDKFIHNFILINQPRLQKYRNYYDGHMAIERKTYSDPTKPINRICTNFCDIVTNTYNGYLTGKLISYTSEQSIDDILDILKYNDYQTQDSEFMRNMLIYGVAYEFHFLDSDAQPRIAQIDPQDAFCIYDNSVLHDIMYFVRFYKVEEFSADITYIIEVWDSKQVMRYKSRGIGGALEFVNTEPHYYHQVPVSVGLLNHDEVSIFDKIMTLNDAYNDAMSCSLDDFDAFVDAYMVFYGIDTDDNNKLQNMREKRVISIPTEPEITNKVEYLSKPTQDTQVQNLLETIKKNIFKVSAAPDMADENFLAQSGEALKWKLVGFENAAANIAGQFKLALQKRIELFTEILNLKAANATWRDIQIVISRNLPDNLTEKINMVNILRGLVSDKTLLAQIPFVTDVDAEIAAVNEQKAANMDIYGGAFAESGDIE